MTETRPYVPPADIAVERVRPAVKNDDDALAPMRGLLIGLPIGLGIWLAVIAVALIVDAVAS